MAAQYSVVGVGNAIVDVLAQAEEDFLVDNGLVRGAMTLIDADQAEGLYQKMGPGRAVSGGSAANTIAGVASLGSRAAFIGKVADDLLGQVFRHDIRAAGVTYETAPMAGDAALPTARSLILVTPDGERTMNTFLGACVALGPEDIDPEIIAASQVTYLEGYLWDPPKAKEAFVKAAELAHAADRRVALSLSDPFCVERHRDSFRELVGGHVDILFANQAEALSLLEVETMDEVLEGLRGECEIAVVTQGAAGSVVLDGLSTYEISAIPPLRVVDVTGAGDLYAAGFLQGFCQGRHPADAARLGALLASEVIGHFGARPETNLKRFAAEAGLG